jgi:hypothetical protein
LANSNHFNQVRILSPVSDVESLPAIPNIGYNPIGTNGVNRLLENSALIVHLSSNYANNISNLIFSGNK